MVAMDDLATEAVVMEEAFIPAEVSGHNRVIRRMGFLLVQEDPPGS